MSNQPSSEPYIVVDVETTGGRPDREHIIEVGLARIQQGQIQQTYAQLINPGTTIPSFITSLTGITNQQVQDAPTFDQVADQIHAFLTQGLFVAHNARFDYGFLQAELDRSGYSLPYKYLCTVKLARQLIPEISKYNLDAIINHCHLACPNRHRALDDALVLGQFIDWANQNFGSDTVNQAIKTVTKSVSIPKHLDSQAIDNIPNQPGIYQFIGEQDTPIYIGKSLHLKDRVRSHFTTSANLKDQQLYQQTKHITYQTTAGELGALIRESEQIKSQLPLYNRQLRKPKLLTVLLQKTNQNGYHTVEIQRLKQIDNSQLAQILGVHKSPSQAKQKLTKLAKQHQLCPILLGLETPSKSGCFSRHLHQCQGACLGQESAVSYNLRFTQTFYKHRVQSWPFTGPIIVTEQSDIWHEQHLIHQWIYFGRITTDKQHQTTDTQLSTQQFEWDTYKILSKHLLSTQFQSSVTQLSQAQFDIYLQQLT